MQTETNRAGDGSDATAQADGEQPLDERLLGLERETRALRARARVTTLGLAAAFALLVVIAVRPTFLPPVERIAADVVEAKAVLLVDTNGQVRGEWTLDENGGARFTLLDDELRPRLSLSVLGEGVPGLSLTNAAGQRRVALALLPDETTSLVFADGGGIPRAVLGLTRGEAASLVFADSDGVSRVGLGLDRSGTGSLMFPDDPEGDIPGGG